MYQTTVKCPICKKTLDVPAKISRSDVLWKHINKEHTAVSPTFYPQTLPVVDVESVPPEYRYLVGWLKEPAINFLPSIEAEPGEKKIDAVMKQLKQGVESIQGSENFRQFLNTMAKFHDYSIGNQILIMLQRRDATRVAGFNTWRDLERFVKKGEKGIAILAPIFPPLPTCPQCGAKIRKGVKFCPQCGAATDEEEGVTAPHYFKVVHVFDISQTEGKDIPEIKVPTLTGEANEELFDMALGMVKGKGVHVSFEPDEHGDPELKGYYRPPNEIWVRPGEPRAQQLKSLLHEIAHYFSENVMRIPRADAETIAESAAYVVGAHYGFDSGVRSFPYVAVWAKDKKVLEHNLADIRRVATAMLDELTGTGAKVKVMPQTMPWTLTNMEARYSLSWAKEIARERGLSTAGSKRSILARIIRG